MNLPIRLLKDSGSFLGYRLVPLDVTNTPCAAALWSRWRLLVRRPRAAWKTYEHNDSCAPTAQFSLDLGLPEVEQLCNVRIIEALTRYCPTWAYLQSGPKDADWRIMFGTDQYNDSLYLSAALRPWGVAYPLAGREKRQVQRDLTLLFYGEGEVGCE